MDVVTYALLKKKIASAATGINDITIKEENDKVYLAFQMGDGSEIKTLTPIKEDSVNIEVVPTLPTSDISETTIYIAKDSDGNLIQYIRADNDWIAIGGSSGVVEGVKDEDIDDMFW